MTAIKERIIGAVTIMNDSDAEKFWNIILNTFTPSWDSIEDVEPDEYDLQMLKAIESDPECHEFTPENEIDWEKVRFVPEEAPLPDEIEAIERANKSIAEHGTIPHDAIDWD